MTRGHNSSRRTKARRSVDPTQYTPCYAYRRAGRQDQVLYCEDVSLARVADAAGTPAYVYSRASIEAAYRRLDRAFGSLPHTLCYAMKANSNLSVLRVLARLGSGFDIVSGGELDRLRRIGVAGSRIVFSGVGKTRDEIREALRYPGRDAKRGGILLFNVESAPELDVLLSEAARHVKAGGARPSAAIRVNPDVLAGGHPHIATGAHQHKFGVDWQEARRLYLAQSDSRWIAWRGITAHIGSQISSVTPYRRALTRLASYVRDLARNGVRLDYIDIGGGLGIRYTDEPAIVPGVYARALAEIVRPLGCRLLIEPGRMLVGPAGVLLTRVLYVKENRGKTFVVVDAAMNDLIRPVLYDATHPITPAVRDARAAATKRVDVVGPVCESGDFLARDWPLAPVKSGDLLVIWTAGAYGFVQSSNYNARRRAAEVLVEGRRFAIARQREKYDDLVRGELL
ncbi:MAG TPA: diaminopimelate decarboxylase [Candidatus Acidoferrales bacterium]|nr:diaminopimelate decarboxylase [Candidatus Acidoferrales bacterium]